MNKKTLAMILAFFIVFAPVYSYAVLPALAAAAASATGRVLVGQVIKRVGQAALSRAGMVSMAAGAGYMASTKSAIEQDGWTIDYGSGGGGAGGTWESPAVDENGNVTINIYKLMPSDNCGITIGYTTSNTASNVTSFDTLYAQQLSYLNIRAATNDDYKDFSYTRASNARQYVDAFEKDLLANVSQTQVVTEWKQFGSSVGAYYDVTHKPTGDVSQNYYLSYGYYKCLPYDSNKIYMDVDQFNNYVTVNNVTVNEAADNVKNIYNYDYSQHPTTTINNNTYGGNNINNDLSISADPELRVSPRLRLDIESNRVGLDDVNDTNCTKNDAGEYDVCNGSEPDPEEETDPENPPPDEEEPPIECSANAFYKKVCDWMDWTQQNHSNPPNTEVFVEDKTSGVVIDDSRIDFDDQCPAPKEIDITVSGFSFSDALDYQPLCDFFIKLKPFVVGMGGISSALIIAGGVRRG